MRKIIVGAMVSMDGVMQAPGGPTEDPTKGFKFGGWQMAFANDEGGEEIQRLFSEKFDLLLGRKTYEIFAAYWPYQDGAEAGIANLFNDVKKYVVSRSGEVDTSWQNSVLLRDIAAVKRLKQENGPKLLMHGSSELVHALLANDLVDEIGIFTFPVVLGSGKKLFAMAQRRIPSSWRGRALPRAGRSSGITSVPVRSRPWMSPPVGSRA